MAPPAAAACVTPSTPGTYLPALHTLAPPPSVMDAEDPASGTTVVALTLAGTVTSSDSDPLATRQKRAASPCGVCFVAEVQVSGGEDVP